MSSNVVGTGVEPDLIGDSDQDHTLFSSLLVVSNETVVVVEFLVTPVVLANGLAVVVLIVVVVGVVVLVVVVDFNVTIVDCFGAEINDHKLRLLNG